MSATTADANAAAADAAREARAEATPTTQAPVPAKGKPAKTSKPTADHLTFDVSVWITDFNLTEFGFYKNTRNRAKSRQFTTDMDIFAEVTENGQTTGLLGYREELWKKPANSMDKRLVVKLFSADLNWRATMDLMVGRSLQQTVGARGFPITSYSINTNDDDFMIYVERSGKKFPWQMENFAFFIMHEGRPVFYRLRRDFFAVGGDYTLYDQQGNVVGDLDGSILTIGGHWRGRVKTGVHDKRLLAVMKLFCAIIIFNRGARRHIKSLFGELSAGRLDPKLERQENDLYMNPRRMR
ncbi:MAG: hypothetical protein ABL901_18355 [Hyphomicrobiaceae bacterium]